MIGGGRPVVLIAAILLLALPVAFGIIRVVNTGDDVRYLWLAAAAILGSLRGSSCRSAVARHRRHASRCSGRLARLLPDPCARPRPRSCWERQRISVSRSSPRPSGSARASAQCSRPAHVSRGRSDGELLAPYFTAATVAAIASSSVTFPITYGDQLSSTGLRYWLQARSSNPVEYMYGV